MKKKRSLSTKMRWVADGIYAFLCMYQMLMARALLSTEQFTLQNVALGWVFELGLMVAAGALAVWLLSSDKKLSGGVRRGVVVFTALVIVFELVTYSLQATMVNYFLLVTFPSLAGSDIWFYIFVVIRLIIWILGAFFVLSTKEETPAEAENLPEAKTETTGGHREELVKEFEAAVEQELAQEMEEINAELDEMANELEASADVVEVVEIELEEVVEPEEVAEPEETAELEEETEPETETEETDEKK